MHKKLLNLLVSLVTIITINSNLSAQSIQELQDEVKSYEVLIENLNDSLARVEAKIDSLHKMIDQLNYESLLEGGREIYLKPNTMIYEGNHVSTPVVAELPEGGTAILVEIGEHNYTKVNYQGNEGFVPNWNIEEESEALLRAETERVESERIAEAEQLRDLIVSIEDDKRWIQNNSANLRSGPSTENEIIEQFERGKEVFVQSSQGNWLQVRYLEQERDRELIEDEGDIENVYKTGWLHESLLSDQYVAPISMLERRIIEVEERSRQRRTQFVSNNPELSDAIKENILNGYISIGMTKEMVRASWGEPDDINRTIRANYTREQWIYGYSTDRKYIYFENNTLTTIQD